MIIVSLLSLLPVLTVPYGPSGLAGSAALRVVQGDEVADAIRGAGKDVAGHDNRTKQKAQPTRRAKAQRRPG